MNKQNLPLMNAKNRVIELTDEVSAMEAHMQKILKVLAKSAVKPIHHNDGVGYGEHCDCCDASKGDTSRYVDLISIDKHVGPWHEMECILFSHRAGGEVKIHASTRQRAVRTDDESACGALRDALERIAVTPVVSVGATLKLGAKCGCCGIQFAPKGNFLEIVRQHGKSGEWHTFSCPLYKECN